MATTVPLRLKRSQFDKSSIPHSKTKQSYIYFFGFIFMLSLRFASGGSRSGEVLLALCCYDAGLRTSTFKKLQSSPCLWRLWTKNKKGLKSHQAEQPFCLRFRGTEMGGQETQLCQWNRHHHSTWPPAPLTFILFNSHFYQLFRFFFFVLLFPPLKGNVALKTAKNYDQPQRKHFTF